MGKGVLKTIKTALIDNGVSSFLTDNNIFINNDGKLINNYHLEQNQFSHGTNCYLILKKYASDMDIHSIVILDSDGKGEIKNLELALQWCCENQVKLINMSFGSTHFKDMPYLRKLLNHYVKKGLIIICAGANNGYTSFPASFSAVIGVAAIDSKSVWDYEVNQNTAAGIDYLAFSEHTLNIGGQSIVMPKSNSYAAPFITALVHNYLCEHANSSIVQIKRALSADYIQKNNEVYIYFAPDWIEHGCIIGNSLNSKAAFYFQTFSMLDDFHIQEKVDTLIIFDLESLNRFKNESKHIVYLGNEKVEPDNSAHFFWCKHSKLAQINHCPLTRLPLDVPLITVNFSGSMDEFWFLQQIKMLFRNENYNMYAASDSQSSVLYELEYLPLYDIEREKLGERLRSFLWEEVKYKMVDVFMIGSSDCYKHLDVLQEAQLSILITSQEDSYRLLFSSNTGREYLKIYDNLSEVSFVDIYKLMLGMLNEESI